MAKQVVSADELVTQALVKVATADAPLRLTGKGDPPPLFASATGANKTAIAQLQAGLVAPMGDGKAAPVRLTAPGFRHVLPHLPEDRVGVAAKGVAAELPAAEQAEFLDEIIRRTPPAAAELLPLYEAAVAADKAEAEARVAAATKRREAEEATRAAVARWLALSEERRRQRVAALTRELEAEGGRAPAISPTPPPVPPASPALVPATTEDAAFRRQVARRLVSTWIDAWDTGKPDARQFLESAIWNVSGFRQIGEPGVAVVFDGSVHEGPGGLFTGDRARVVRPGWAVEEDDREYVVAKALVEK